MPLVDLPTVLGPARKAGYAVGAFNITGLDMIEPILDVATELRSPVILSIAEVHLKYIDLEEACFVARAQAAKAPIPVVLHLDHGLDFDTVMKAIRFGCTAVMFDGSTLPYGDNVARTREIVQIAHGAGISVEAELGCVLGGEGTGEAQAADPTRFTIPEQAVEFVAATGIDALAVAFGTVHGFYKGKPQLDLERLRKIRDLVAVPLVMHGGSGLSDEDFQAAIGAGISKVNYFTEMSVEAVKEAKRAVIDGSVTRLPDLLTILKSTVSRCVREKIKVFGSEGKA